MSKKSLKKNIGRDFDCGEQSSCLCLSLSYDFDFVDFTVKRKRKKKNFFMNPLRGLFCLLLFSRTFFFS